MSGVRAKVTAIKSSGVAGQPYVEVELLDGSGRTPTLYPSMVEAAPEQPRWEAPHVPLNAAASDDQSGAVASGDRYGTSVWLIWLFSFEWGAACSDAWW